MNAPVTWQAPDPCPECDNSLTLADDGTGPAPVECGSCDYADTWTVTEPARSTR